MNAFVFAPDQKRTGGFANDTLGLSGLAVSAACQEVRW